MAEHNNPSSEVNEKGWEERKRDALEIFNKFGSSLSQMVSGIEGVMQDILYPFEQTMTQRFANIGQKTKVAIFWDFENFALPKSKMSAKDFLNSIQPSKSHYNVVAKKVFGKESHLNPHLSSLKEADFAIIRTKSEEKQATDIKLQNSCLRFCSKHPEGIVIILISGDGGYIKMIKELVGKGHEVRLIHSNKQSISQEMKKLVPIILDINSLIDKRKRQLTKKLCKEEEETLWLDLWKEMINYEGSAEKQIEILHTIGQKGNSIKVRSLAQKKLIELNEKSKK